MKNKTRNYLLSKTRPSKLLALILISALLLGILPSSGIPASKATARTVASAATDTSRAGYGVSSPTTDSSGVTTWDTVYFGNYWQNDTNGDGKADKSDAKELIKWRVLSVNGDDAFLLADQNLDCQEYNDTYVKVTWETCTMRSWLNGYGAGSNVCEKDYTSDNFLDNAFSASEQAAIKNTTVVNADNPEYGTEGGNDTTDKVYLLSIDEVLNPSYGFTSTIGDTKTREARNTAYAKAQGAWTSTSTEYAGNGDWWLRSPGGSSSYYASGVNSYGYVYQIGSNVDDRSRAVRPALHLNLSSTSSWSYAGTVTSEGGQISTASPTPGSGTGSSGLTCEPSCVVKVDGSESLNARVFAQTKEEMESLSSNVSWESSDESIATVQNVGFIQATSATKYSGSGSDTSLWWASGLVMVKGKKAGTAVITGKLSNGSTVSCQVTVTEPESSDSSGSEGNAGSLILGEDKDGSADDGKGVAQFFPASWSLKSSKYPVQMSQKEDKDGNYTLKVSVGIGRSDIFDKDTEWSKYKKACDAANKSSSSQDQLESYRDLFGLKSSTVVHSSGWKGSKKPSLSIMGYVECKYDKYGNIISNTGKIAGDLKWSGDVSWQFATPIGPMYLKLGAEGKASLEGRPSWDAGKKKASIEDGKLTLTPAISLTGGYGIDKVASLSATGKASLDVQVLPPSKATFTAEASVNVYALFIIDYTWTLARYTSPPLWDTTKTRQYRSAAGGEGVTEPEFIDTDFAEKDSGWQANTKNTRAAALGKTILKKGLLPSSLPMLAQIGDRQVLVWQEYDKTRDLADSTVLMYSVYKDNVWSEPAAVCDDGYGDACADLKVIGGKLCLTWQKHKGEISAGDASDTMAKMGECAEIYYAEFDSSSDTFTGVTQVTDNAACDMMPEFVAGTDKVQIAWVRNDAGSIMQSEGVNTIYRSEKNSQGFASEEKLAESPGTVDRFVCYEKAGKTKAIYVTKTDSLIAVRNSDNTVEDALSELILTAEDGTVSALNYVDGNIHLICNGILYCYDLESGEMLNYEAGDAAFDGTAIYCSNGTKSGYIWSIYDEEQDKGRILASMLTADGYSNPVTIYETEGEISRCIAPILTNEGEWNLALNQEETESGIHDLSYVCQKEKKQTSLISAYVQESDVVDGKTGVEYVFTNAGDTPVEELLVQVTLSDGTVIQKKIQQTVNPGATVAGTAYLDLSGVEEGQSVRIAVCEAGQVPDSDDVISDEMEQTDVALVGTATEDNDGIQVTAYATNRGKRNAKVDITLFHEPEKQNKLEEKTDLDVAPGQTEKTKFTVAPSEIRYSDNGTAYLTLYAEVEGGDYEPSNNVAYLALYKGEKVYANTEEKGIENPVTGDDGNPEASPSAAPTVSPSVPPTSSPSASPTGSPSVLPTVSPEVTPAGGSSLTIPVPSPSSGSEVSIGTKLAQVTGLKLKAKKKAIQASWKKAAGATGYELWYSTSGKWKKKKVKTTKKTKLTIGKLKSKKTYFIRVRAYTVRNGKKVYGKWSKTAKRKMK